MPINYRNDRIREKHISHRLERKRPLSREQRKRFAQKEFALSERDFWKKVHAEKHPDRLKKLLKQVPKNHKSEHAKQEQLRLQKMMETRRKLKEVVKSFSNQPQSAERTKDSMTEFHRGRVTAGIKGMANMSRYGAIGSKHERAATQLTKVASELKQQTSDKVFKSILFDTLKQASSPIVSYEQIKDVDGKDKNLEGRQSEKSNQRQMAEIQIKRAKGLVGR